ncbi:Na/Pi symporter [Candidatus Zixiibacteriota bacterium]
MLASRARGLYVSPPAEEYRCEGNVRADLARAIAKLLGLFFFLYAFLVSIGLIGKAFKFFGKGVAETILTTTADPLVGLFAGVLATSIVQSSSTVTSFVVILVGGGGLPIVSAIPIVMGANIGTSVTSFIVSLGHITRRTEFQRAFAAATVHDFFNIIAVIVFFPLQYFTNFLGIAAEAMAEIFAGAGGLEFASPLQALTNPIIHFLVEITGRRGWILIILGFLLLAVSLRYIVVLLKSMVLERVERFFSRHIFRTAFRSFVLGIILTATVQSSSVTISIAIPLAGSGVLSLAQMFPYAMGANIGTTVTGILASLATGSPAAVAVAFAHLLFNIFGCVFIWPIRRLPILIAETFSRFSAQRRWLPIVFILGVFFVVPLCVYLLR